MELGKRAIDGAFWNIGLSLANKGVKLGGQLALAWLLMPADMGLANLAMATASFPLVISVGGLSDVLLQRQDFEDASGQAFWLSLATNCLIALIIAGLGWASPAMGRPQIRGLLWVIAVGTALGFPTAILTADLKHRLDFKGFALGQMVAGFAYTALAVLLAWRGWGPYALVIPVALQTVTFIGVMLARGGRVFVRKFDPRAALVLLKPALWITVAWCMGNFQTQIPIIICSWRLKPSALGYFSWGWMIAGQAVFLFATNLREILLPVFTQLEDDPARRAKVALKAARVMTAMLTLACGAQALLARAGIVTFLQAKWVPAVPVVMVASMGLVAEGVGIAGMAWLNACRRYRFLLLAAFLKAAAAALFTFIGLLIHGLIGAAVGCALGSALGSLLSLLPMDRRVLLDSLRSWVLPALVSAAALAAGLAFAGDRIARALPVTALFVAVSGLVWWRGDDGGLRDIARRVGALTSRN